MPPLRMLLCNRFVRPVLAVSVPPQCGRSSSNFDQDDDPEGLDDDWEAGLPPDPEPPWEVWDPDDDEPAEPEPGDFWPDPPFWDE